MIYLKPLLFLCSLFLLTSSKLVVRRITTTIRPPTTTKVDYGCPTEYGFPYKVFKRKAGYWCMIGTYWPPLDAFEPMMKDYTYDTCYYNGMVLSSLESEEEWDYWYNVTQTYFYKVTGVWIAAAQDPKTKEYFWNDGNAIKKMKVQPTQNVTNGLAAWYPYKDASKPYGYIGTTTNLGNASYNVNMGICGVAGRQFH